MGNYLTQTGATTGDLTNAVGSAMLLQLFSSGSGAADQTAINNVIADAESIVDGYLVGEYEVPITTGNAIVKTVAKHVAVYLAYARRPEFFSADGRNPWQKMYDWAERVLNDLRSGKVRLPVESAQKPAMVGGVVLSAASTFICDPNEGTASSGGF